MTTWRKLYKITLQVDGFAGGGVETTTNESKWVVADTLKKASDTDFGHGHVVAVALIGNVMITAS